MLSSDAGEINLKLVATILVDGSKNNFGLFCARYNQLGTGVNANNNTEPMGPNSTVLDNKYVGEAGGGGLPFKIQSNIRMYFDRGINFLQQSTWEDGGEGKGNNCVP